MSASLYRIIYNGITIEENTGYTVNKSAGFDGLEIRTSEDELTGADGGNIWEQRYKMRTMSIEGRIFGTNSADYFAKKRAFVKAFAINSINELYVRMWDGTERYIPAFIYTTPMIEDVVGKPNVADYRIELKAPYPFFADLTETSYSCYLASGGGFPVPAPVPAPVGSTTTDTVSVINNGDVSTYPTITIQNACQNPTVRNMTTGKQFTIADTLVVGDVISLSKENGIFIVTKNGVNIMPLFSGEFPDVQIGANTFKFTALSYNSSAICTITFANKYLSA